MCFGFKNYNKEVARLQKPSTIMKQLFIVRGIVATIIAILMFYPMFGGTLTILNGTFIYFSYFLAIFLVAILGIIDFGQLIYMKKHKDEELAKENILAFMFLSLMVMIGLLEGHYIFSPLMAIIYIFLLLLQLFQLTINKEQEETFFQIQIVDIIQRVFFYATTILLLLGNQPFEFWGIPVATTALFVFVLISVINFIVKMRKI